jgi:hypothetical protein
MYCKTLTHMANNFLNPRCSIGFMGTIPAFWIRLLTLGIVFIVLTGCAMTHMNRPDDASIADQAVTQAQSLADNQTKVFDTIDANNQAAANASLAFFQESQKSASTFLASAYATSSWADLQQKATSIGAQSAPLLQPFDGLVEGLTEKISGLPIDTINVKHLQAAADKADRALKDINIERPNWDEKTAFWAKLIEVLPPAEQQIAANQNFEQTLSGLNKSAGNASFTYTDANGKTQTKTLAKEASDDIRQIVSDGSLSPLMTAPPGLAVQIASLAKDLADAELQRAITKLHLLQAEKPLLDDAIRCRTLADQLQSEIQTSINKFIKLPDFNAKQHCANTISMLLKQSAGKSDDPTALENGRQQYATLIKACFLEGYLAKQSSIIRLHEQILEKQNADAVSRINMGERQALVSRSVDSLKIYHDGGIKPQEIAQFVYATLQLGTLSAIAAK